MYLVCVYFRFVVFYFPHQCYSGLIPICVQETFLTVLRDHKRYWGWNPSLSYAIQVPYLLYSHSGTCMSWAFLNAGNRANMLNQERN